MWQVIARVINQGVKVVSREACTGTCSRRGSGFKRGFDENDLYKNLAWLAENQSEIEKKLLK